MARLVSLSFSFRILVFAALAVAYGCAAAPYGDGRAPAAPEAASAPNNATTIVPIVQAKPDESATPAPQPEAGPKKPDVPSESDLQAASGHRPEELIGLKTSEITQLLGHPSLVRRDVPAQVWQYRNRDCVLDLYLYPPAAAGKTRGTKQTISDAERTVVYYELRGKNATRLADDRCFISIIAGRGGQPG